MSEYRVTRARRQDGSTWDWYIVDADRAGHGIESRAELDQFLSDRGIAWQDLGHRRSSPSLFSERDDTHAAEQLVAFKRRFDLAEDSSGTADDFE